MNTTAIRQAIKLYQQPVELAGFMAVNAALPAGITDLLRLCASESLLQEFCDERDIDSEMLYNILTHYIEKVLFKEGNTAFKILGIDKNFCHTSTDFSGQKTDQSDVIKQHYKLLMKIYHPDRNRSSSSSFYAAKISKAYDAVKRANNNLMVDDLNYPSNSNKNRFNRPYNEPPQSFYQATQQAQLQLNRTRNTFFGISALFLGLVMITLFVFNQTSSPNLIVRHQASTALIAEQTNNRDTLITPAPKKTITKPLPVTSSIGLIQNANFSTTSLKPNEVSASQMQLLLHDLESAYEQGEVTKIKPILANAPEMQQQSDASLNEKLETLFKITQQRKMVLYDFSWKTVEGKIQGEGKFLSRFLLTGEDEWQTRTGVATVKADINNDKVSITQLKMDDQVSTQ